MSPGAPGEGYRTFLARVAGADRGRRLPPEAQPREYSWG